MSFIQSVSSPHGELPENPDYQLIQSRDDETICAVSTAPGTGGIAVLRISGSKALAVSRKICSFLPEAPQTHRAYFGVCRKLEGGDPIDEVVATYFAHGRSFTGEETVEISCHGGTVLSVAILKELVRAGSRVARRGEFTYRAFMNGRLDLVQAESVLTLIESQNQKSAKLALRQLQGQLSKEFGVLEDGLVWMLAHLEASIDFSTEGLETISNAGLVTKGQALASQVSELLGSYSKGRAIREGLQVVLVGRPNVGKSSLLNALLKEDRAIVTAQAGTTRDLVEGTLHYSGIPVTFVDTAGLRETENEVEKIGIARSKTAMQASDLVFHIIDPTQSGFEKDLEDLIQGFKEGDSVVINKADLPEVAEFRKSREDSLGQGILKSRLFWVSALSGEGLGAIEELIRSHTAELDVDRSNVVTQARHVEGLEKIRTCLTAAMAALEADESPEFVAFELQDAIRTIHELVGKQFDEQVIDRIFKEFCLGK